jgi:hypothetical protein
MLPPEIAAAYVATFGIEGLATLGAELRALEGLAGERRGGRGWRRLSLVTGSTRRADAPRRHPCHGDAHEDA